MTDLAGRSTGGTVSVVAIAAAGLLLAIAASIVVLRRRTAGSAEVGRGPWIGAGAAAVVLAALVVVYAVYPTDDTPTGGFDGTEREAIAAASTIAANLSTFSRASFTHDFDRALSETTGALHSQVSGLRSTVQQTLTQGKFDLKATVRHTALVGPADPSGTKMAADTFVVLVNLYGYQSSAPANPSPQNLQLTVQKIKGVWKASDATKVDLQ